MKQHLENFKNAITVAGPLLIFMSIIKAMIFYYAFGIRITDYVSFGEALLLFFDDILVILSSVVLVFLSTLGVQHYLKKPDILLTTGFFKGYIFFLFVMLSAFNGYYLYEICHRFYGWDTSSCVYIAIITILIPCIWLYSGYSNMQISANEETDNKLKTLIYKKFLRVIIAVYFLAAIISTVFYQVYRKLNRIDKRETATLVNCIMSDSTAVHSSRDTVFLGRTTDYIFFYSYTLQQSLIYKTADIKKIEIRRNKDFKLKLFHWFWK